MENNNNLQQNILDKINTGEIKMQSKTYFALHLILLIIVAVLILLASSFIISFILFGIQASGRLFLLGFGFRGFGIFILTFPWFTLLIDIVLIVLLERLLKQFPLGYRNPLLYTIGGIILVSLGVGYLIEMTPLHSLLLNREQHRDLPLIGGFYSDIRRPPHESGVFRGTVISLQGNTFMMENADRDSDSADSSDSASSSPLFKVFLDPSISAASILAPGDTVFVAGDIIGTIIHAYGIKKLPPPTQ